MMKQMVAAATTSIVMLGLGAGVAEARHGADDGARRARHGGDDGARHDRDDDHGHRHGGHGSDD